MKQTKRLLLFFSLLAVSAMAQTVLCGSSISSCTVAMPVQEWRSAAGGVIFNTTGGFGGDPTWSSINMETRKDDGKGLTLAQLKLTAKSWNEIKLAPPLYLARAEKVGLESAATDEAQMLQAIHDAELHLYDFARVDDYLYRKALKQGTNVRWVWAPVREKDMKNLNNSSINSSNSGIVDPRQYTREIPDRVLADMERIMDCAPVSVIFLASDYRVVHPDPFLGVTTPRMLAAGIILIVDQWDEPGFTESPESVAVAMERGPGRGGRSVQLSAR